MLKSKTIYPDLLNSLVRRVLSETIRDHNDHEIRNTQLHNKLSRQPLKKNFCKIVFLHCNLWSNDEIIWKPQ